MKSRFLRCVVFLVSFHVLTAISLAGPIAYYFEMPPIEGESTARNHPKEIAATGFQLVVEDSNTTTFVLQKSIDKSTTDFLDALGASTQFDTPKLTVEKLTSGALTKFFTMVFSDVAVVSVKTDTGCQDGVPVEKITFSFSRVVITYFEQNPRSGAPIPHSATVIVNPTF